MYRNNNSGLTFPYDSSIKDRIRITKNQVNSKKYINIVFSFLFVTVAILKWLTVGFFIFIFIIITILAGALKAGNNN